MSTTAAGHPASAPASAARVADGKAGVPKPTAALIATIVTVLGVFSIYSTDSYLWSLWTTDGLKSIGALVPVVSLVLILRAWRGLGWTQRGTWWGLVVLAATIAVVHLRDQAIIELVLTPSWAIFLPPHSLVALAYTSGAVLLFGGTRLYRAALFPICLTWFVNPVPQTFNLWIDLPLQHASAAIARGFAHMLHQPLTPDQLRLMFTPDFGMFIAPGCNGIRGAVTMGFIALVAGYLYRFPMRWKVATLLGAVLLGYVFNFVRLCLLVVYYVIGLHITWLQTRAEMGDYIIGACLFFFATLLLFNIIRRLSPTGTLRPPPPAVLSRGRSRTAPASFVPRLVAMVVLVAAGSVSYARGIIASHSGAPAADYSAAIAKFPQQIGSYKLDHTWNERLLTGALIFNWAEYAPADGGPHVAVGISPVLGTHDTLLCHSARGEDWLWHDTLLLRTAAQPVEFSATFFTGGAAQYLEATTMCSGTSCGQVASARQHLGLNYSRPDTKALFLQSPTRPIPVMLRIETPEISKAPDAARDELTRRLRAFVEQADLATFTAPYR